MDNRRQDSEHYQTRANGSEWVTLERKHHGKPGEIRVAEIDEVIAILRRAKGADTDAQRETGSKPAGVKEARGGFGSRK